MFVTEIAPPPAGEEFVTVIDDFLLAPMAIAPKSRLEVLNTNPDTLATAAVLLLGVPPQETLNNIAIIVRIAAQPLRPFAFNFLIRPHFPVRNRRVVEAD
jgi:hypothetical protein